MLLDILVDVPFDLHLLGDDLDDELYAGECLFEVDNRRHPLQGGIGLLVGELVALGELLEAPLDVLVAVGDEVLVDVAQADVVARHRGDLGDAVAHAPRAEHRDGLDVVGVHHSIGRSRRAGFKLAFSSHFATNRGISTVRIAGGAESTAGAPPRRPSSVPSHGGAVVRTRAATNRQRLPARPERFDARQRYL
jgi:hypothetical protein